MSDNHRELRGYVIEHTAKRLKRAFQQTLTELGADLTADQWVVLDVVAGAEGLSQHEIGQATVKDRPTVTRILDRLEEKQLIERREDPGDRRKFGIHTTARGKQRIKTLQPKVRAFRRDHFAGLKRQDINDLKRILDKINTNISTSENSRHALP